MNDIKTVSELQFSLRVKKGFNRGGITTLDDLLSKTAGDLLLIRNFGATSLAEVREKLVLHGLALLGDPLPSANQGGYREWADINRDMSSSIRAAVTGFLVVREQALLAADNMAGPAKNNRETAKRKRLQVGWDALEAEASDAYMAVYTLSRSVRKFLIKMKGPQGEKQ